jgi:hypothetical protein
VGLGRVYVKLDKDEPLTFDNWIAGVKNGRSYCGDGKSHIFDFQVNGARLGVPTTKGDASTLSQLKLKKPGKVKVSFDVAAMIADKPTPQTEALRKLRLDQKPYWHIERSRVGKSRKVPVEVIVNGQPAARAEIVANGETHSLSFDLDIPHSSWIAVRILPSVHTNPIFVQVGEKPIRASRKSADWCAKAVDVCWDSKQRAIRDSEKKAAKAAYLKIKEESVVD